MALNGIPISDDDCIGDSLDTINESFVELDSRTLALSSSVSTLNSLTISLSAIASAGYGKLKFTGNNSTTFNSSSLIGSQTNSFLYRVDVNGVVQEPGTNSSDGDYYLNSGNLIFTTAPVSGTKIVMVGPISI
jgi:hypothetical protein